MNPEQRREAAMKLAIQVANSAPVEHVLKIAAQIDEFLAAGKPSTWQEDWARHAMALQQGIAARYQSFDN